MNYQPTLLVPGTWSAGKEDPYWGANGSFVRYLEILNWIVLSRGEPFWTTNLEGGIFERLFGAKAGWHRDWTAGGRHLLLKLKSLPPEILAELIIICHSHGLQVVLYALAAVGCPSIKGLISVGSPDRADMQDVQALARTKIAGHWLHLQMGDRDNWSWLGTIGSGALGDTIGGAVGLTKGPELADRHDVLTEFDHSEILNDPTLYDVWPQRLDYTAAA